MSGQHAADPDPSPGPGSDRSGDFPRRIRVGTIVYRVSDTAEDWADATGDVGGKVGETDHMGCVIRLRPGMHPHAVRLTLWHEVLHALCTSVMGGPKWDDLGADPDAREETVILTWEHPTLAVLRDNPGLVRYLTAE